MLSGDNGLLQKAGDSKEKTERAQIIEEAKTDILSKQTEKLGDTITEDELEVILTKYGTLSEDGESILDETLTSKKGNYEIAVKEIYDGELKTLAPGLYDIQTGELKISWSKLIDDGILVVDNNGVLLKGGSLAKTDSSGETLDGKLIISNDVKALGNKAFAFCNKLKEIKISESITSVGEEAFFACDSLNNLIFPENVTSFDSNAFTYCSLTDLTISGDVTNFPQFNGQVGDLRNLVLGSDNTEIGLKTVPNSAFPGCPSLENVIIKKSVRSIENSAFVQCNKLNNVVLSEGLSNIGNSAFNCKKLEKITIPSSVRTIDTVAFGSGLKILTIIKGTEVLNIKEAAFYNTALTDVYYTGTQEDWNSLVNIDNTANQKLLDATKHWEQEAP